MTTEEMHPDGWLRLPFSKPASTPGILHPLHPGTFSEISGSRLEREIEL